jgi:hypothetical protein
VACPFCAATLSPGVARNVVLRGRLTRAAVFGAALVVGACGNKTDNAPKPAQGSSDPKELERMLDEPIGREPTAHAAPIDAAVDAAAIAAAIDAGVPPDAGPDAAAIARRVAAERKRRDAELRKRIEEEQREAERLRELQQQQQQQQFHNAKPYGAPPARRRLV